MRAASLESTFRHIPFHAHTRVCTTIRRVDDSPNGGGESRGPDGGAGTTRTFLSEDLPAVAMWATLETLPHRLRGVRGRRNVCFEASTRTSRSSASDERLFAAARALTIAS